MMRPVAIAIAICLCSCSEHEDRKSSEVQIASIGRCLNEVDEPIGDVGCGEDSIPRGEADDDQ